MGLADLFTLRKYVLFDFKNQCEHSELKIFAIFMENRSLSLSWSFWVGWSSAQLSQKARLLVSNHTLEMRLYQKQGSFLVLFVYFVWTFCIKNEGHFWYSTYLHTYILMYLHTYRSICTYMHTYIFSLWSLPLSKQGACTTASIRLVVVDDWELAFTQG